MTVINPTQQATQDFRTHANKLKTRCELNFKSCPFRDVGKSPFDYLTGARTHDQEFYLYEDDLLNCAMQLAQLDGRCFFSELERIRQWNGRCDFVIRPVIHRFMNQSKVRELASILEQVPGAAKNTGNELANAKTALEVILGLLEFLEFSSNHPNDDSSETVKSLLEEFLSSRSDQTFLRLSVGCYLMHILQGKVDPTKSDKGYVKADKLMFSWLVSSPSCRTKEAAKVLMRVLGIRIPSIDTTALHRFRLLGLPPENKKPYSLLFLMANELELPLSNQEWRQLAFASIVFQSASVYWKADKNTFSILGLNISDWISRTKSPIKTAMTIRRFVDAAWYRMRAEYLTGSFTSLCQIAELDLMIRVCLIDHLLHDGDYDSANKLFDITWADCSLGLYLGERDVWNAPYNYIQFLFYYKVAKLDPHSRQWHNVDLLNGLPLRGRDNDALTCRELCVDCLLKNGSTVPWNDIAMFDPKLNDEIQQYRNKVKTGRWGDGLQRTKA